jgi:hypothetical protein
VPNPDRASKDYQSPAENQIGFLTTNCLVEMVVDAHPYSTEVGRRICMHISCRDGVDKFTACVDL